MMPTSVLRTLLLGTFGWIALGLGIYLIWEWADGIERSRTRVVADVDADGDGEAVVVERADADRIGGWPALAGGIALILLSTVGPFPLVHLISRRGLRDPDPNRSGQPIALSRPDGSQIHAEVYGAATGPTLICTHGWSLDRTDWMYVVDRLSRRYRVVVWDLPGLGRSKGATNRDCSLEKYAEDLHAVIGATGEGTTVLVGHSIGGMIMQVYCRLHPEALGSRVHGLALVHTTYRNPLTTMLGAPLWTALQKPLIEPLNYLMIPLAPLAWLSNWQSYLNGSLQLTSRITSFAGRQSMFQIDYSSRLAALAWPAVLARGNLAMLKFDETLTLPKISVPTLVVAGDDDRTTKREASERLVEMIPTSRLAVLDPGGHLGHWETHERFIEILDAFVISAASAPEARSPGLPSTAKTRIA